MIYFFGSEKKVTDRTQSLDKMAGRLSLAVLLMFLLGTTLEAQGSTLSDSTGLKIETGPHNRGDIAGSLQLSNTGPLNSDDTENFYGTPSLNGLANDGSSLNPNTLKQGRVVIAYLLAGPTLTFGDPKKPGKTCSAAQPTSGCQSQNKMQLSDSPTVSDGKYTVVYSGVEVKKNQAITYSPLLYYSVDNNLIGVNFINSVSVPPSFYPTEPRKLPTCSLNDSSTRGDVELNDITYTGSADDAAVSDLGRVNVGITCTGNNSLPANVGVAFQVGGDSKGSSRYKIPYHEALSIVGRAGNGDAQPDPETFCSSNEDNIVKTATTYPLGNTDDGFNDEKNFSKIFWWGVCENKSGIPGAGPFSVPVSYEAVVYS